MGVNCEIAQWLPTYIPASTVPPNPSCLRNPLPNFPHRAIWHPLWLNPQDPPKDLLLASQQTGSLPTFSPGTPTAYHSFVGLGGGILLWVQFWCLGLTPLFFVWGFLRLAEPSPWPFILFYFSGKLKWARKLLLTPSTVRKTKYTDRGRR